ncbi:site-specific integrase [Rhodococcus sp. 1.20]
MLARQVDSYLDHLAVERGSARNTLLSYRRDLNRYAEYLHGRGIDDVAGVTENDVTEFVTHLRLGDKDAGVVPLAASSAARTLIAVRGFHKFSAAEGLVGVDVARTVKPPTPGRKLPKALPLDDVIALLDASGGGAAGDGPRDLRDRALLELLYSTGARITEAIDLDVDDIDTETRSVLLKGKGGKQRIVPVGRPAIAAVDAYLVRGRPSLATRGVPALFSTRAVDASRVKARGRYFRMRRRRPGSRRTSHPTRSGTRLPHTCSTAARTYASCRNFSVTLR